MDGSKLFNIIYSQSPSRNGFNSSMFWPANWPRIEEKKQAAFASGLL
jgi:hypothetical protein